MFVGVKCCDEGCLIFPVQLVGVRDSWKELLASRLAQVAWIEATQRPGPACGGVAGPCASLSSRQDEHSLEPTWDRDASPFDAQDGGRCWKDVLQKRAICRVKRSG